MRIQAWMKVPSATLAALLMLNGLVLAAEPVPPATPAMTPQPVPAPEGVPVRPVADDYIIGPGDSLQIFVWRNPELSVTIPVRPDGKISTPLVENMVAVGKSPSKLARDIEVVLAEFVRSPQVNVIVGDAASTFSQVKIVGQVRTPQALPYREGLRVLDIVLTSGGLTDFAAPNRARIVRLVDGKNVETRVKLGDLLNDGDLSQNFELKPGDVLIVPQSRF
jgi:polysaccharide biosynthesis/export protein